MNSETVLSFFKEITAIPRESGHEEHIIAYLQDFAAKNNLECKTDEAGNVLITKEAAPGYNIVSTKIRLNMKKSTREGVDFYLLTGTRSFSISVTYCLKVLSVLMRSLTVVHA